MSFLLGPTNRTRQDHAVLFFCLAFLLQRERSTRSDSRVFIDGKVKKGRRSSLFLVLLTKFHRATSAQ